jgi:hypothetical protein
VTLFVQPGQQQSQDFALHVRLGDQMHEDAVLGVVTGELEGLQRCMVDLDSRLR